MTTYAPNIPREASAYKTALASALALQKAGRLEEAERIYTQLLAEADRSPDVYHLLGALKIEQGDYVRAISLLQSAVSMRPSYYQAHMNLGLALAKTDAHAKAVDSFTAAIRVNPRYAKAFNSRGNSFAALDDLQMATLDYERAAQLNPTYAEAFVNAGIVLGQQRRFDSALANFDRALTLSPKDRDVAHRRANVLVAGRRFPEALEAYESLLVENGDDATLWCHRGNALLELGRKPEALESYRRAADLEPESAEALCNRGALLTTLQQFDAAQADLDRALAIAPALVSTHCAQGQLAAAKRNFEAAFAHFDAALALRPDFINAIVCKGAALAELNCVDDAIAQFQSALAIDPFSPEALLNLAVAMASLKRYDEAIDAFAKLDSMPNASVEFLGPYLFAQRCACDRRALGPSLQRLRAAAKSGATDVDPFTFILASGDPAEQLRNARAYVGARIPQTLETFPTRVSSAGSRIRVAYLSANFNQHPVADTVVELLAKHDRSKFEIVGVSLGADDDSAVRHRIEASCHEFWDVRLESDIEVARRLNAGEIDIVVDLMGHTADARPAILAHRAAPIQVNWLGFPGTSGAPFIDYIIADSFVIPDHARASYSEKVVTLPGCYLPIDSTRHPAAPREDRRAAGLPEETFVFCSFNNHYKISPEVFAVWMRLLGRVPGSVLWLQGGNASAQRNLVNAAQVYGVDASRIVFASRSERLEEHLGRHALADLFLDTPDYNAHSTARDALWAGLPVLTFSGRSFASRVAGSLLTALGVPELIARDLARYEDIALQLATDREALKRLRQKVQTQREVSSLFNVDVFSRNIEAAYTQMIEIARATSA
jgi:predicted O-linked N-acetylglucosamine transferase (SPINDLY family)